MGTFEVTIGVGHMTYGDMVEVSALVDTGATDTVLPASLLEQLQVRPHAKVSAVIGNGEIEELDAGQAKIAYNGIDWICPIVFGSEGIHLLGATTLEIFKLVVDPVNQVLTPAPPRRARPF